jgi:hypothetical protein
MATTTRKSIFASGWTCLCVPLASTASSRFRSTIARSAFATIIAGMPTGTRYIGSVHRVERHFRWLNATKRRVYSAQSSARSGPRRTKRSKPRTNYGGLSSARARVNRAGDGLSSQRQPRLTSGFATIIASTRRHKSEYGVQWVFVRGNQR